MANVSDKLYIVVRPGDKHVYHYEDGDTSHGHPAIFVHRHDAEKFRDRFAYANPKIVEVYLSDTGLSPPQGAATPTASKGGDKQMPPLYEVAVIQTAQVGANGLVVEPETVVMAPKSVMAPDGTVAVAVATAGEKLPPAHRMRIVTRQFAGT